MREIKFRAWDKCNERMIEPRNILKICMSRLNQEPYLIVYLRKWMNPDREIREADKRYTNEFNLMQYTGLKDKYGKEIYDSDICVSLDGLFLVVWNEEKAAFEMMFKEDGERLYLEEMWDDTKVIGNLYDNLALWEVV